MIRLDNFWFVLMHELFMSPDILARNGGFYDDLDIDDDSNPQEREADEFAGEALIPDESGVLVQREILGLRMLWSILHVAFEFIQPLWRER